MLNRRNLIALATIAAAALAQPAFAADTKPFTQAAFNAAQAAGKPILVEITAPWCSVCTKQKPIIASVAAGKDFAGLAIFVIDFDSQKDAVRAMKATTQSTLISFNGKKEKSRSVGVTDAASIEALMRSALSS
jgi:thiol-disulfide isomerase/thioredoxin